MYTRHSLTNSEDFNIVEALIGGLDSNFRNKGLYTKSLGSRHVRVGNSLRNLSEFSIYTPGVEPGKYSLALLQFKNINNELKLTSTYPFISITELGNTDIPDDFETINPYVSIEPSGTLTTTSRKEYDIPMLGDVSNLVLNSDTHGYVLASKSGKSNSTKNPFTSLYYYTWTLAPQNSRLLKFNDTLENLPKETYQVLRNFLPTENRGQGIENTRLQIAYDQSPSLGGDLDCNGNGIFNQTFATKTIEAEGDLYTVQCDCSLFSVFKVNCANVNILTFNFYYSSDRIDNLVPVSVFISNFEGAIQFSNFIEFENGIPLALSGSEHILNFLVYNTGSMLKIRVLQKATNLSKVPL